MAGGGGGGGGGFQGRHLLVCRCSTLVISINFANQLQMYDT